MQKTTHLDVKRLGRSLVFAGPPEYVSRLALQDWVCIAMLALFSAVTAIYPSVRTFYRFQVNYNEGWNVYNAEAVARHIALYSPQYSWTTVNYPPLSFYAVAYLSYFTHDYLLSGRLLSLSSLVASCLIVGLIIKKLTGRTAPAIIGGLFCLALFCTEAPGYVGMDDPQMFAQVFFLIGLLLQVSRPRTLACIGATAFLFVLGGSVKHNFLEFPVAVVIDLCFVSYRKMLQFLLFSTVFLGVAVAVSTLLGGPFFVSKLLTPRAYSGINAIRAFLTIYGPIQLPFIAGLLWTMKFLADESKRVIALLFIASLFTGTGLAGGAGGWTASNYFFSNFLAISIICGMLVHYVRLAVSVFSLSKLWKLGVPIALFSSLLYPFYLSGNLRLGQRLSEMPEQQKLFAAEVAFLRAQPGPAICESLLRCYDAGKPYVYDPFDSTSLMRFNKLNGREIVAKIEAQQYGAIQLKSSLESFNRPNDHFPDEFLDAINRHYAASLKDADCYVYVPRPEPNASGNTPLGRKVEKNHQTLGGADDVRPIHRKNDQRELDLRHGPAARLGPHAQARARGVRAAVQQTESVGGRFRGV